MKDAQKASQITLFNLLQNLRAGHYVIPDFQRDFVWQPAEIRELTRSVFLDYYIGNLLLWKGTRSNFDSLACENIYGYQGRVIRVDKFMNEEYDEAFRHDWTARGTNLLASPQSQFDQHMFPLSVVGRPGWGLSNWAQDYVKHWQHEAERLRGTGETALASTAEAHVANAQEFGDQLQDITHKYQISYTELDRDLEIDKVCDIFTQINKRGVRLDVFDLINALIKPKGIRLKHLWKDAQSRFDFPDARHMNTYLLQTMSIMEQSYCSPKYLYYLIPGQERKVRTTNEGVQSMVIVRDARHFKELWERSIVAMKEAVTRLRNPQEYGAVAPKFLPYHAILPAFAALHSAAKSLSADLQLSAQRKVRYWYWASVFSNRYSSSVGSISTRDYLDVTAWFGDDTLEPRFFTQFNESPVQALNLREEKRQRTARYNGTFCLLVVQGAQDWNTGMPVSSSGDIVDDHHVVPRSWGMDNGIGDLVDSVLNRVPLSPETNRHVIGSNLPNQYLPKLEEQHGSERVQKIMDSHLISPKSLEILKREPFGRTDFEEFLDERQRTLIGAIESLLGQKPLVQTKARLTENEPTEHEASLFSAGGPR